MKKNKFDNRRSQKVRILALVRLHRVSISIGVTLIVIGLLALFLFKSISPNIDLDTFEDMDISGLDVPGHLLMASSDKVRLVDLYTKEVLDEITFDGPVVVSSDAEKQYFIIYDSMQAALFEVYAAIDEKAGTGVSIQKELIEDNISDGITLVAISTDHYAYATDERVYMKSLDSGAIQQTIDIDNSRTLRMYKGMLYAANDTDFSFYSIYRSEPSYYRNYSSSSVHFDDEIMIVANNYGQTTDFSLIYQFNRFGNIDKVIEIDSKELFFLQSLPNENIYLVKGKSLNALLHGTMEELNISEYEFALPKGVVKNEVLYLNNGPMIIVYNQQPYYRIPIDSLDFALLFNISEASPRQEKINQIFIEAAGDNQGRLSND